MTSKLGGRALYYAKKELLQKFRLENSLGDERENYLDLKSYSYGICFSSFTFILIFIISKINDLDYTNAVLIFLSIIMGQVAYKYIKNRKNMGHLQKLSFITFIVGACILYISYVIELVY